MDLIDDERTRRAQHPSSAFAGEQNVKRFGRGDDNVGRLLNHGRAILRRRVAGAHQGADFCAAAAARFQDLLNPA